MEFSSGTGAPVVDRPAKVATVRDCLRRIRRVAGQGLPAFGRVLACAGWVDAEGSGVRNPVTSLVVATAALPSKCRWRNPLPQDGPGGRFA